MARWLTSLAFILFLLAVGSMTHLALAAVDSTPSAQPRVAWQGYPAPTETISAYPGDVKETATPTATDGTESKAAQQLTTTPQATFTSQPGSGATATLAPTRTPTLNLSATATPSRTITPTPTFTVQALATFTLTPIRVSGLPVPGPGDRLPSTGGSLMSLFTGLVFSGGLGALLFVLGRLLKRRA